MGVRRPRRAVALVAFASLLCECDGHARSAAFLPHSHRRESSSTAPLTTPHAWEGIRTRPRPVRAAPQRRAPSTASLSEDPRRSGLTDEADGGGGGWLKMRDFDMDAMMPEGSLQLLGLLGTTAIVYAVAFADPGDEPGAVSALELLGGAGGGGGGDFSLSAEGVTDDLGAALRELATAGSDRALAAVELVGRRIADGLLPGKNAPEAAAIALSEGVAGYHETRQRAERLRLRLATSRDAAPLESPVA